MNSVQNGSDALGSILLSHILEDCVNLPKDHFEPFWDDSRIWCLHLVKEVFKRDCDAMLSLSKRQFLLLKLSRL
jgi:hypothetical protein